MFCSACGAKLRDNAAFCNHCGRKIGGDVITPCPPPAPPEQKSRPAHGKLAPIIIIGVLVAVFLLALFVWPGILGDRRNQEVRQSDLIGVWEIAQESNLDILAPRIEFLAGGRGYMQSSLWMFAVTEEFTWRLVGNRLTVTSQTIGIDIIYDIVALSEEQLIFEVNVPAVGEFQVEYRRIH